MERKQCVWVSFVEGKANMAKIRELLDRGEGYEVTQLSTAGFLVVGPSEKEVQKAMEVGFLVVEEALLRVARWTIRRGTFLDIRVHQVLVHLAGTSLILCNEVGATIMVNHFGVVEAEMVRIVQEGNSVGIDHGGLQHTGDPALVAMKATDQLFPMKVVLP